MPTYEFYNMETGQILDTIVTDDPDAEMLDVAVNNYVLAENVFYEKAVYGLDEAIDELVGIQLIDLTGKEAYEAEIEIVKIFRKLAGE